MRAVLATPMDGGRSSKKSRERCRSVSNDIRHDRPASGKSRPQHWRGPAGEGWSYPHRDVCGPAWENWYAHAVALCCHLVAAPFRIAGVRQRCAHIPRDAWQLASAIDDSRRNTREWTAHTMIGNDPNFFYETCLLGWGKRPFQGRAQHGIECLRPRQKGCVAALDEDRIALRAWDILVK